MALLCVDAAMIGPDADAAPGLGVHLAALAPDAPVVILIHGFRYDPASSAHDPARYIYADCPGAGRSLSWAWHLGIGADTCDALAIGFGWRARGSIWRAEAASRRAGAALARLIRAIRTADPARRINVLAHSLGASVLLAALPGLRAGDLDRAVLMSAAILRHRARRCLDTPAGRTAEFLNVTSRENDLFDFILELAMAGGVRGGVSHGIGRPLPNWTDLQIDSAPVLAGLAAAGFPLARPSARICHWSVYQRAGIFALYRAVLAAPDPLPLSLLAERLPDRQDPRWSRLIAAARDFAPLPFRRGASS